MEYTDLAFIDTLLTTLLEDEIKATEQYKWIASQATARGAINTGKTLEALAKQKYSTNNALRELLKRVESEEKRMLKGGSKGTVMD